MINTTVSAILAAFFAWASVAHADVPSPALDRKLDTLYDTVSKKFEANPWFKNAANPDLYSNGSQTRRMNPEFSMPTRDDFKSYMKSYCVLMESPYRKRISRPSRYSIVDFTENATFRRVYVYDVPNQEFIHNTWTAHATNTSASVYLTLKDTSSGYSNPVLLFNDDLNASFFSNDSGSNQSTIGMTISNPSTYWSSSFECKALRMNGVDGSLNSKILSRAIVVHAFDYQAADIRYYDHLPASWGCIMIERTGFYKGVADAPIADTVIKDMTGGPILLYHERLKPEVNERVHQEQLAVYADLQLSLDRNVSGFAAQYHWSPEQTEKFGKELSQKLKAAYLDPLEQTYQYFKTPSKYVGKEPKSDAACIQALHLK